MILQLKIVPAKRCSKQDITAALDIYCKSTDPGSWTDTNQICDHIWNSQAYRAEPRQMFFYLLYDNDGTVEGFSEFAYLPENRVLVLDYLCTRQRNPKRVVKDFLIKFFVEEIYVAYIVTIW